MKNLSLYFNKALKTYEKAGKIQKKVADELLSMIPDGYYSTVVEIGSGTGLLSIPLIEKIDFYRFIHIDISYPFLKKLRQKLRNISFYINAKAENIPLPYSSVDLILSSSTLHWLSNPEKNIVEILKLLKDGGRFYFSIFTSNTLREIKRVSQITGFGSVYNLMPWDFYISLLKNNSFFYKYELKTYMEKYASPKELLLAHKLTGTNYTENKRFSGKKAFNKFCEVYKSLYGSADGVYATYEILFIEGQKLSPSPQF